MRSVHEMKVLHLVNEIGLETLLDDNDITEVELVDLLIERGLIDLELYFPTY